jgi:hypothetical protein
MIENDWNFVFELEENMHRTGPYGPVPGPDHWVQRDAALHQNSLGS